MRKLCTNVCSAIVFTNGECLLRGHSKTRTLGKLSDAQSSKQSLKNIDLAKLWHLRLGHLPFSKMKLFFPDIDVNKVHESTICIICPVARQTRKAFPSSSFKTTKCFHLIHLDVRGPYKHVTHDGCHFFLDHC